MRRAHDIAHSDVRHGDSSRARPSPRRVCARWPPPGSTRARGHERTAAATAAAAAAAGALAFAGTRTGFQAAVADGQVRGCTPPLSLVEIGRLIVTLITNPVHVEPVLLSIIVHLGVPLQSLRGIEDKIGVEVFSIFGFGIPIVQDAPARGKLSVRKLPPACLPFFHQIGSVPQVH